MDILVINCGSSSLKYQLIEIETGKVFAKGLVEKIGKDDAIFNHKVPAKPELKLTLPVADHKAAFELMIKYLTDEENGCIKNVAEIDAVGHRLVHGGEDFSGSVYITEEVLETLKANFDLAPLHNPYNYKGIIMAKEVIGDIPMVGVFDTAFHQSMKPYAYVYPLPYDLYEKHKIRRYGFHGTSHYYVCERATLIFKEKYGKVPERIITCHLGNGASITAIFKGKSLDTSMGFTPLEGIMMGTRCGDIDPAIIFYLMDKLNMPQEEVYKLLNKKSGVLGVSGLSNDFRDIIDAMHNGNRQAELAFEIYCYRIKKYIGAYTAALGGLDVVVFTAGIGENVLEVRERILSNMEFLGIYLDKTRNIEASRQEREISMPDSKVKVFVIPTNEELVIANDTAQIVQSISKISPGDS